MQLPAFPDCTRRVRRRSDGGLQSSRASLLPVVCRGPAESSHSAGGGGQRRPFAEESEGTSRDCILNMIFVPFLYYFE